MKLRLPRFIFVLAASAAMIGSTSTLQAVGQPKTDGIDYQSETYFCDESGKHPTLTFRSDLGNARLIEFRTTDIKGWPPVKRCKEIAERSLEFHELGIISYLTKEVMPDGTNVICISKSDADHMQLIEDKPDFVRLLITLLPDDDPQEILDEIRGISSFSSDGEPLIH